MPNGSICEHAQLINEIKYYSFRRPKIKIKNFKNIFFQESSFIFIVAGQSCCTDKESSIYIYTLSSLILMYSKEVDVPALLVNAKKNSIDNENKIVNVLPQDRMVETIPRLSIGNMHDFALAQSNSDTFTPVNIISDAIQQTVDSHHNVDFISRTEINEPGAKSHSPSYTTKSSNQPTNIVHRHSGVSISLDGLNETSLHRSNSPKPSKYKAVTKKPSSMKPAPEPVMAPSARALGDTLRVVHSKSKSISPASNTGSNDNALLSKSNFGHELKWKDRLLRLDVRKSKSMQDLSRSSEEKQETENLRKPVPLNKQDF